MRHVRAVAVFGIVLITLTGSRGGGCDSSSSSSSSTTGGSHDNGTSGGDDYTDAPTPSPTPTETVPVDAMSEVTIDFCSINPAATEIRGQLQMDNDTAFSQTYDITVHFEGDSPTAAPIVAKVTDVTVGDGQTYFMYASAPYTGPGKGNDFRDCKVVSATRTPKVS